MMTFAPPTLILRGQTVRVLMRRHGHTIASLAAAMGLTQRRVRTVRQVGLTDRYAARDWLQALTGTDPGEIFRPIEEPR